MASLSVNEIKDQIDAIKKKLLTSMTSRQKVDWLNLLVKRQEWLVEAIQKEEEVKQYQNDFLAWEAGEIDDYGRHICTDCDQPLIQTFEIDTGCCKDCQSNALNG